MKTILLVDDDKQVRTMFGLALRRNGYNVVEADSGVSGLEMARKFLPTLILSDVHMPGGDGATLLQEVRRDPELRTRQVVLMTGRPDLVTPRRGMEEGADDFLVKPVSMKALMSCVEARFSRATISWRVEDEMVTQLRSTVPSNLPHECFTPLAGIIGLMEVLRTGESAFSPAEIADIHRDVHLSAIRLHRTLRNYLTILDLQGRPPEPAAPSPPLSPDEIKKSVHIGVEETLKVNDHRRADVVVNVASYPIAIKDQDLTRIVEELLDNACKFSRQGTPITVELTSEGRLTVTDRGRGMTEEEINHIGAFRQFDRKKHEQQGLGLGLVLVQKLAAPFNAEVSFKSQPGEGTEVQVAFPPAKA
jgi:two-component system sensor histidine kinase/response regulator